jgi:hypothetical protein
MDSPGKKMRSGRMPQVVDPYPRQACSSQCSMKAVVNRAAVEWPAGRSGENEAVARGQPFICLAEPVISENGRSAWREVNGSPASIRLRFDKHDSS